MDVQHVAFVSVLFHPMEPAWPTVQQVAVRQCVSGAGAWELFWEPAAGAGMRPLKLGKRRSVCCHHLTWRAPPRRGQYKLFAASHTGARVNF